MCERSKSEVLARELCIQRFLGITQDVMYQGKSHDCKMYVDAHWKNYESAAREIIATLDKHGH